MDFMLLAILLGIAAAAYILYLRLTKEKEAPQLM